ncbi:21 kDa protein-like [Nymphaea colorata]|uniref:Pectinesterase inhibitor domain-containing protein n=1 Tax=Nymphaea colorata TaxID=210225 RepID=A0A5K1CPW6_9MAGN|nr:21 kDa protein-like [Nymphaea colorata]
MASLCTSTQFFSLIFLATLVCSSASTHRNLFQVATNKFILSSCRATRFPAACYRSLGCHAREVQRSPRRLAHAALSVSLDQALSTCALISKLKVMNKGSMTHWEIGAMGDCIENVGESIYLTKQSLKEMEDLGSTNWGMLMSDLQTWVSAADTCMDGFAGGTMNGLLKQDIRSSIEGLAQMTSNALDFINRLSNTRQGTLP